MNVVSARAQKQRARFNGHYSRVLRQASTR
jgi:hypothetical protein